MNYLLLDAFIGSQTDTYRMGLEVPVLMAVVG